MKRTMVALAGLMLTAGGLAGCMRVKVDESTVFAPVAFDAGAAASSGETVIGERAFANADAWASVWAGKVAAGALTAPAPEFVATRVEHGRTASAPGGLAWTTLTRGGEGRPLIVRCGGNASTRQNNTFVYGVTALPHGDVLLFDYPGSGETGGQATPERFVSMSAELTALVTEKAEGRPVILWGHSLGGFVCSELSKTLPATRGVILEATARNPQEVAKAWTPWYAGPFVQITIEPSLAAYDNAEALAAFKGPVLVLGATKDQTLPVVLARDLDKALTAKGVDEAYVEFPDGGHSNLPGQSEFPGVIAGFFAKLSPAS